MIVKVEHAGLVLALRRLEPLSLIALTCRLAGLVHNYTVRFTVADDAADRLQGEIAKVLESAGWTVRRDPRNTDRRVTSVRFLRDSFSIGAKISDLGNATAGGSSGASAEPYDLRSRLASDVMCACHSSTLSRGMAPSPSCCTG